jgi:RP/EB family microtubule-associated protein
MKRVDFNVRSDYEFVQNYKELQQAFNKVHVDRAFNVSQLSKGKRQDNNEFMQFMKGYFDSVTGGQDVAADYDAVGRRSICKTGDWKKFSLGEGAPRPTSSASNSDAAIPAIRRGGGPAPVAPRGASNSKAPLRVPTGKNAPSAKEAPVSAELTAKVAELQEQITELKLKTEAAERERDFYFDKLRDIEILCQAPELADVPVLKTVEKVLYAADTEEAKAAMIEAQEQYGAQLVVTEGEAEAMSTTPAAAAAEVEAA